MALTDDERIIGLAGLIAAVTDVRHHDGVIHANHLLEVAGRGISHIGGIDVTQILAVSLGDQAHRVDIDAEESHTLVAHGFDPIGLEQTVERCGAEVIIGADFHGINIAIMCCKFFHAVVKLMITQNDSVIAQSVHQCIFHVSTVDAEIERALNSITGMNQHGVGVLGAQLVIDGTTACHTAQIVAGGINLAVGVIHCDNRQVVCTHSGNRHQCAQA